MVEAARAEDGAAIQEISRRHEALSAASRLAEWWRSNLQIFRAVREQSDAIAGFYCMFDPTTVCSDDLETDPISQQWRRHLRGNSAPKNKRALFIRRWLSHERGEEPSPVQAACWLDINLSYDALRCKLSRPHRCRKLTIVAPLPANQLARWPPAVWLLFSSLSPSLSAMIRHLAGIA